MITEVLLRQEVILGIIDHFKRHTVQQYDSQSTVVGGVQGRVTGNQVSCEKVFEVAHKAETSEPSEDYLDNKLELEKLVNPELDLVGFYIAGKVA